MTSKYELVSIPRSEWPQLRDLFLIHWPEYAIPYNAVQNCINWISHDPSILHLRILSLDGVSWRLNGTFVLKDRHELYFFSLEQSNECLEQVLELIDWRSTYRIVGISDRHQSALENVLRRQGQLPSQEHLSEADHYVKILERDEFDVQCPPGFRLGALETRHAQYVNSFSDHPTSASEDRIMRYIAWNPSVAVFNEWNEPLAWCLLNNLGIISLLYTDERYRHRGFAELVVKAMLLKLVDRDMNVANAAVTASNVASKSLFEKVGFRKQQVLHYTNYNY
ncbi:uncharacterized protein LOC109421238 [Aedes albopictus]|uniref:N-acetyltransferase domain-containing protein n=1 Tax=Aedes albopictus TaxID=7160 RepID=A0ABM1ZB18_AEDAL|nr:uncharacterized protein LOC109421238 [Aedes albopictus]